jgi:hypothetical protein
VELYLYSPYTPSMCVQVKYHLDIFNGLNDVNSKFKVGVYSPSLAAGSANGNILEALKVQEF